MLFFNLALFSGARAQILSGQARRQSGRPVHIGGGEVLALEQQRQVA